MTNYGLFTDLELKEQGYKEWLKEEGARGDFVLKGSAGDPPSRSFLWETTRKVFNGQDPENVAQLIGDCVSHGGKHSCEYLQLLMMALGTPLEFKYVFAPYFYGASRVFVGGQKNSYQDGSVGAWCAKAAMKYGMLASDTPNCPKYSAAIAKAWGAKGPDQQFVPIAQKHIVKSTALVSTIDQFRQAISNYYPVTVASDVGFDMLARKDGLMYNSCSWSHQMLLLGYDLGEKDGSIPAHAAILNNWGPDCHGVIYDFRTKEKWPSGTLRVPLQTVGKMLGQGDSFSWGDAEVFEARALPPEFFRPWVVNDQV